MIFDYLTYQLSKARYELIEGGKRYYGEIPGVQGVWAAGKTLEECRHNLLEVLEGWLVLRLKKNLAIPDLKQFLGRKLRETLNV
jgi:predicted RNase H-like HicB family nuclease